MCLEHLCFFLRVLYFWVYVYNAIASLLCTSCGAAVGRAFQVLGPGSKDAVNSQSVIAAACSSSAQQFKNLT